MALKSVRSILIFSLILVLLPAFIPAGTVHAMDASSKTVALPLLDTFINQVKNGQANELRGVYVPDILAAPVVQQPKGDGEFVSPRLQMVTQFSAASQLGSTGLLAHNYLAGESFFLLEEGQTFYLIYGDGRVKSFVVTKILEYQALTPNSISSNFIDLKNDHLLTTSELFFDAYDRPGHVVFQTCIADGENLTWGRLFVIAQPYFYPTGSAPLSYTNNTQSY